MQRKIINKISLITGGRELKERRRGTRSKEVKGEECVRQGKGMEGKGGDGAKERDREMLKLEGNWSERKEREGLEGRRVLSKTK